LACELVRNGRIGKLHTVRVGLPGGHMNPGYNESPTPMPAPKGFTYDMWLGPAPWAPYRRKRCHWTFRWILDYSGGQVTDWGAHYLENNEDLKKFEPIAHYEIHLYRSSNTPVTSSDLLCNIQNQLTTIDVHHKLTNTNSYTIELCRQTC